MTSYLCIDFSEGSYVIFCSTVRVINQVFLFDHLDGQTCINNPNISISENQTILEGVHIIMLDSRFGCNGRITSVAANMFKFGSSGSLPMFQVWRPLSPGSSNYSKIGQVQFKAGVKLHISNVSLTGKDQIKFQSGDVIGCYQPSNSHYRVGITSTVGTNYTSYSTKINSFTTTVINVRSINYSASQRRPLISVMIGEWIIIYVRTYT